MYTFIYVFVYTYRYIYISTHIYVYIYINIYTYIYIYIHIYILPLLPLSTFLFASLVPFFRVFPGLLQETVLHLGSFQISTS